MSKTDDIDTPVIIGDYRMMTAEIVLDGATEDGEAITWRDYDRTPGFPRLRAFLSRCRDSMDYQVRSVTVTEITESQLPACRFSPSSVMLH